MESLKTYTKVNKRENSIHFGISKMEDIYIKREGKKDVPHRHKYYTILIIKHGNGEHKIDFTSYPLGKHQIFFVAPGQVHQVIENEKTLGFSIAFSNQFLIENSISLSFIENLNLFNNYGQSPPLNPKDTQFEAINGFAEKIFELYTGNAPMRFLSIGAFLKLLLIQCNNICTLHPIEPETNLTVNQIIKNFKEQVDQYYKEEHSTSFYAEKLNITPDYLNRKIKEKIGTTAKDYIQSRIITEAKRLLYFTDLSNKEIAYDLGFNEPSNFSNFFKKHTHSSPSNFKKLEIPA
ncbi:helix-turn-helix domain-containing protein [Flavobacteriaceae bacterium Ap0902]|nr:helix-turn-helix domain-containing protein [Flavobacteriaceae bacterium Ap0902]